MPPLSVVKRENSKWLRKWILPKMRQAFFPQCESCSNIQGGLLSKVMRTEKGKGMDAKNVYKVLRGANSPNSKPLQHSYNHALRPRLSYLGGIVVAYVTTTSCEADGELGDYREFRRIEKKIVATIRKWLGQ